MNDAGLAMVMTAGPGLLNQGLGLAGCVLPRVVLERASTVAEAIDLLEILPGSGYGLVYVLADPSGDCAVVEKVHDRMAVRGRAEPFVWAVNRFEDAQLESEIVALPREGLDASNAERSEAIRARVHPPPTSRQDTVRLLHTPPIHQRGTTSSFSVHTAAYTCRDRELLVWGADIDEPERSYRV
jgi:hypothetical protein